MRSLIAALLVAACASAASAQDMAWPPLVPVRATDAPVARAFQEERHISFLNAPVRLTGILTVDAAGRLTKEVTAPTAERMVVDDRQIVVERPPGTIVARLSLRSDPVASTMILAIRAVLAADQRTMRAAFLLTVGGTERDWSMLLVPTDETVRDAVASITVRGAGAALRSLELVEANGDRTVLTLGGD